MQAPAASSDGIRPPTIGQGCVQAGPYVRPQSLPFLTMSQRWGRVIGRSTNHASQVD